MPIQIETLTEVRITYTGPKEIASLNGNPTKVIAVIRCGKLVGFSSCDVPVGHSVEEYFSIYMIDDWHSWMEFMHLIDQSIRL